jgi:hypothetical protein
MQEEIRSSWSGHGSRGADQTRTARRGRPDGDELPGEALPVCRLGARRETSDYACVQVSSTVTSVEDAEGPL